MVAIKSPLFPLGQLRMTPGIMELGLGGDEIGVLVRRHVTGDFGDLDEDDRAANAAALDAAEPGRVFSAYTVKGTNDREEKVYIITEWDRSATTILTSDEY